MKGMQGFRIRSRLPHFEESEPNISYYARLEKIRGEKNLIYALKDDDGLVYEGTKEVLRIAEKYYSNLFKEEPVG
jgi:hypothetical protein